MEARLAALAGTLPLDRLSLAVNTEAITHVLVEESRSWARADESSRTRLRTREDAGVSRNAMALPLHMTRETKGQQPCRTSR